MDWLVQTSTFAFRILKQHSKDREFIPCVVIDVSWCFEMGDETVDRPSLNEIVCYQRLVDSECSLSLSAGRH
tara:strand:+ start:54674 stop:54889 length:216 start_codon:yes stop_codon:yes gene_type:complete